MTIHRTSDPPSPARPTDDPPSTAAAPEPTAEASRSAAPTAKRLRRRVRGLAIRTAAAAVSRLSVPQARAVVRGLAAAVTPLLRRHQRRLQSHLALAFPEATESERRRLARGVHRHFAGMAGEILSLYHRPLDELDRWADAASFDPFVEPALEGGKGAIIMTGHFGNWEWLGPCIVQRFGGLTTAARSAQEGWIDDFVLGLRRHHGVDTVPRGDFLRPLLRVLRSNGLIAALPDQDIPRLPGRFVPFFGQPAYTPIGPFAIAAASGTPIVPVFLVRDGERYRAVGGPLIRVPREARRDHALLEPAMREWTACLEGWIRRYPEQWTWFHRRWRTRPEDLPPSS